MNLSAWLTSSKQMNTESKDKCYQCSIIDTGCQNSIFVLYTHPINIFGIVTSAVYCKAAFAILSFIELESLTQRKCHLFVTDYK